ncbi:uncharacterized, partial [Tachysurus ichikawai]
MASKSPDQRELGSAEQRHSKLPKELWMSEVEQQLEREMFEQDERFVAKRRRFPEQFLRKEEQLRKEQERHLADNPIRQWFSEETLLIIYLGLMLGAVANVIAVMWSEDKAVKWLTSFYTAFEMGVVYAFIYLTSCTQETFLERWRSKPPKETWLYDDPLKCLRSSSGFVKSCCVRKSRSGAWQ